jgi:putative spermidine/putrescine transport system permease protein
VRGPFFKILQGLAICFAILLIIPLAIIVPISVTDSNTLAFPPQSFSLRWYEIVLLHDEWNQAILNSVKVALTAMTFALLAFVPAGIAMGLSRKLHLLMPFFMSPLIIPPLILSIGLYFGLGTLRNSFLALPIAHAVFAAPIVVLLIRNSTKTISKAALDAAVIHGASMRQTIQSIILPSIMPAVLASAILAFLLSFNEPIFSMYLSTPWNQTLPVKIWGSLRFDVSPATAAVGTLSMLISALLLVLVINLVSRSFRRGQI